MADPVWQPDQDGGVRWQNRACADLISRLRDQDAARLFRETGAEGKPVRMSLITRSGEELWYAVTAHCRDGVTICHATSVTELVASETAQHRFVQTLAKTFAHLSIGLAIFDRDGQLGIFNPALVDLTGLQPGFLATKPTMVSFFDQLRENRRMPEPKNYRTWRQDIADVIAAASGGQYRETWTLEDGRTFAVQGRPHPDGATAFLIEDISPEITLTRSFRIEVEQYEALMDSVEEGFAVFSSTGILTFCNAAYRRMFDHNPESAFADVMVQDAIAVWQARLEPTDDWRGLSRFIATLGPRGSQTIALQFLDGTPLTCRLEYLSSDATLVRFSRGRCISSDAPVTLAQNAG